MNILDLIEKKKNNLELNEDEFRFFVNNYNNDLIPNYQAAALLMAIRLNGCSDNEVYYLTKTMLETCNIIKPIATNKLHISIDKHSSGGIGDKVSLIICPILSALGYDVVKVSGRGLLFTGGTIDKLESIGVICEYDKNTFQSNLNKVHFSIMLQNQDFAPIDKKIYSLRDVTGTVDSFPLIAASIMCKKLCLETDYIFLDIKVGDGAFCKTIDDANELTRLIKMIANKFNRKVIIFITTMNSALGYGVGNAIEIKESIEFLNGQHYSLTLKKFIYDMLTQMLEITKVVDNKNDAIKLIDNVINSKSAYNRFIDFVKLNNGKYIDLINDNYWKYNYEYKIYATQDGYINYLSSQQIGYISLLLGAGRINKDSLIDFGSGIIINKENGQKVKNGDLIATLYSDKPISDKIIELFINNCSYELFPINKEQKIIKVIK